MNCPECFSNRIQEVYIDGEFVCRGCGLVIQSHVIDTSPIVNIHNIDHYTLYDTEQCLQEFKYVGVCLDIPDNTVILADELFKDHVCTKGTNRKATMARVFLKACQETNINRPRCLILGLFEVTEQDFVGAKTVTTSIKKTSSLQARFACHAQHLIEDEKQRRRVLNIAGEIDNQLQNDTHYMNTKQSKMDGVVFAYVAQKLKIGINKKDVINVCQMSNVTFNKHIKFLSGLDVKFKNLLSGL